MGFLRRLLGKGDDRGGPSAVDDRATPQVRAGAGASGQILSVEEEERAHVLELARFEQDRMDDLVRRQLRFADRSWTPPAQGGDRRADGGDAAPK